MNCKVLGLLGIAVLFQGAPALAGEDVVARFRVLQLNIYGRDYNDCEARYRAIARNIVEADPPYDIVSLNEHWDTFGDPFTPTNVRYQRSFDSIRANRVNVVRWKTPAGKDVSDHYGLNAALEIVRSMIPVRIK